MNTTKGATSSRKICAAIKKATGYEVKINKGDGSITFYSDDNSTSLMLGMLYTSSVDVPHLSSLTVRRWVEEFKYLVAGSECVGGAIGDEY